MKNESGMFITSREGEYSFVEIKEGRSFQKGFFADGNLPSVGDVVDIVCVKSDETGLILQFKKRGEPS